MAQPQLVGVIGILDSVRGGLEGRIARLLQKECNTTTRANRLALLAAALFGLSMFAVVFMANVRAADKEHPLPPTAEELLGAKDFWLTTGAAAKHDFDEKQMAEIRRLATQSPKPVIRIRASKLVCDLDGHFKIAQRVSAELATKAVGAAFTHLESSLADATVAKFAPEKGFTHYAASTRDDKDQLDSVWILVESVDLKNPGGGLNLRYDIKSGKIDKVEQWGVIR